MNLGWIRSLFIWSRTEKGRAQESVADPRDTYAFSEIESLVSDSVKPMVKPLVKPSVKPSALASKPLHRSFPDQAILQKILVQRPAYTSSRILKSGDQK